MVHDQEKLSFLAKVHCQQLAMSLSCVNKQFWFWNTNRINLVIHVIFQGEFAHAKKKQSSSFNRKKSQIGLVFARVGIIIRGMDTCIWQASVGYFAMDAIALSAVAWAIL